MNRIKLFTPSVLLAWGLPWGAHGMCGPDEGHKIPYYIPEPIHGQTRTTMSVLL